MPSIEQGNSAIPLPSAELNLGGTSTSEAQFLTASAQNGVAAGQPLKLYAPGSNVLKGRPFTVRVGGRVTGGSAASNFTGILYYGTSSTIASNTAIATTGARALAANAFTWELEARMTWNGANQINGRYIGYVGGVLASAAILTNTTSSTTLNSQSTSDGFTITGTFSTGQAANTAYVDWFEIITQ